MASAGIRAYQQESEKQSQLLGQHADLVRRIAHHLLVRLPAQVQLDDLIQAGMLGLLEAAAKFDDSRGASFETYAGIRIRGAMLDEIRRGDWAPRSVHRNARELTRAMRSVERATGREAQDREVAEAMGIPLDEYHRMLADSLGCKLFSFEALLEDEQRPDLPGSGSTPGDQVEREHLRQGIAEGIAALPERDQLVLSLYYDEELNLKEIGAVLGVSESRVSQIMSQAMLRLRGRLQDWLAE